MRPGRTHFEMIRRKLTMKQKNLGASGSNTTRDPAQRGYAKIRIRSYSPQWVWRCQSRGYRQLCSLWFEYNLCLNRKPPNDFKNCLTTLIRIRSTSVLKGVKLRFKYDQRKLPNELGTLPIKWVSTAMFSLVRIRPLFEQEAPKWPYCLRLDSNTIISRILLQVIM